MSWNTCDANIYTCGASEMHCLKALSHIISIWCHIVYEGEAPVAICIYMYMHVYMDCNTGVYMCTQSVYSELYTCDARKQQCDMPDSNVTL